MVVTVHAERRDDPLGERVKIAVQDTGIGIPPEDLARLARPFEQIEGQHTKTQQGTGLGLALTKALVEMHGGPAGPAQGAWPGHLGQLQPSPVQQSKPQMANAG